MTCAVVEVIRQQLQDAFDTIRECVDGLTDDEFFWSTTVVRSASFATSIAGARVGKKERAAEQRPSSGDPPETGGLSLLSR